MSLRKQPNILFVFSDQHRWCDLGCYGNADVISPNFDRFAQNGLQFNQCVSNAPVCVPARGSLLTGLYPLKHRAITNDLPIRTDVGSVADVLNDAGYHTGYIGKWHLGGVPRNQEILDGHRLGFKEWKVNNCDHSYMSSFYCDEQNVRHEIDGYDAETYTSLAIDFMERSCDTPWGLWLSWGPPHDPYFDVPQKYLDLYADKQLSLRGNVPGKIIDRLDRRWDREQVEKNLHGYYAHITALDDQFGRIFQTLEKTGQLENTMIVYTSDHGDQLGSQGWTNKQLPFEESVRVPLLMRGPGVRQGICGELIGLTDLPASLLSQVGLKLPASDGDDLSALFSDSDAVGQDACYIFDLVPCHQSTWRGTDAWRGLRTKTHTYACHADGLPWVLFDNIADPEQKNNLAGSPDFQTLENRMHQMTIGFSEQYDALLPWPELLVQNGLVAEWNKSQRHFGLPELCDVTESKP